MIKKIYNINMFNNEKKKELTSQYTKLHKKLLILILYTITTSSIVFLVVPNTTKPFPLYLLPMLLLLAYSILTHIEIKEIEKYVEEENIQKIKTAKRIMLSIVYSFLYATIAAMLVLIFIYIN